jgi:hypothetical protein
MTPSEINELLNLLTLGEGSGFENSKDHHVVGLGEFEKSYPSKLVFLDRLKGTYRSDFVDSVPRTDDQGYTIELTFGRNSLTASIVQSSRIYYQHSFSDLKAQLGIGKSPELPPNLFVELPAKPELGYVHPIYLEIMIGADMQSLIAVMYNTNQLEPSVNYLHAENLIFSKID